MALRYICSIKFKLIAMKTRILIISLFTIALTACHVFDPGNERYGFDCDFNNNGKGLVMSTVGNETETLKLQGGVVVEEGVLNVYLKAPSGDTVYNKAFEASKTIFIDTAFVAQSGIWSLSYKSFEGKGQLNLHIEKYDF